MIGCVSNPMVFIVRLEAYRVRKGVTHNERRYHFGRALIIDGNFNCVYAEDGPSFEFSSKYNYLGIYKKINY